MPYASNCFFCLDDFMSMAINPASLNIPKKTKEDFKFLKEIGIGSYSTVGKITNDFR